MCNVYIYIYIYITCIESPLRACRSAPPAAAAGGPSCRAGSRRGTAARSPTCTINYNYNNTYNYIYIYIYMYIHTCIYIYIYTSDGARVYLLFKY